MVAYVYGFMLYLWYAVLVADMVNSHIKSKIVLKNK